MPSKPQPKAHVTRDGKMSWDKVDAKPTKVEKFTRRCRACGIYLTTLAEERIGIHVSCIQELNIKANRLSGVTMSRPRYGSTS